MRRLMKLTSALMKITNSAAADLGECSYKLSRVSEEAASVPGALTGPSTSACARTFPWALL
jgi:hypothetical protein